ncbi:leucyl aminopeptidase [Thalassospiraceae bacterium LMO-JJ14]|nr:leucyl aminopeptidase [Thalassospiraceae bacterium LMO-JJ14]
MKVTFTNPAQPAKGIAVVFAAEGGKWTSTAAALDKKLNGTLKRAAKAASFDGKKKQTMTVLAPGGTSLDRVLCVGVGKPGDITAESMAEAGGAIFAALKGAGKSAEMHVDDIPRSKLKADECAANLAYGAKLRAYKFEKYKGKEKQDKQPGIDTLSVRCNGSASARSSYANLAKIADGVYFTRDLVSEPPNILYPAEFAKRLKSDLTKLGVKVTILGEAQMRKLGMGSLLSVGDGSSRESQMVVMEWNGLPASKKKGSKPISFIGKGVCFDTGGISLKPSASMDDMKWDMGGAGVVSGLMKALAGRKAKCHVIGAVGLVENMPDGNATRPGDIVKSMSGQTIEILNTDAEGRLVLCDVLHYVNSKYKPQFMVDLATLTGAIIISLGAERAGMFTNDDNLADRIFAAGETIGERVWRFPLGEEYDKDLDTAAADMRNIGSGRGAGSITAAQFLKRFVGDTPWAHLDIAGVTWSKKDTPVVPKGGTAFGVRLLDRFVADHYE